MASECSAQELQVFIDGVTHYFSQVSEHKAQVEVPYLITTGMSWSDYIGVIGVSGARQGKVCFTASRSMLRHVLVCLGELEITDPYLRDITGEIANTISGNARRSFGSEFNISTPEILEKNGPDTRLQRYFLIPIVWYHYHAALVINLQ